MLNIETAAGIQTLGPECLPVAFDETGHEDLADPKYPVFGLGGAAILVRDYKETLRGQWREMKRKYFGGEAQPLHAVDFRSATPEQKNAVGSFFTNERFVRFAGITSDRTQITEELTRYKAAALLSATCLGWVGLLLEFNQCAVVFEHSDRTDSLVRQTFTGSSLKGPEKWQVPTTLFFASKEMAEPIVEIADFVMHAAGTAVRYHLATQRPFLDRRFHCGFRRRSGAFSIFRPSDVHTAKARWRCSLTDVEAGGGGMERAEALAALVSTARYCWIRRSLTLSVRPTSQISTQRQRGSTLEERANPQLSLATTR